MTIKIHENKANNRKQYLWWRFCKTKLIVNVYPAIMSKEKSFKMEINQVSWHF